MSRKATKAKGRKMTKKGPPASLQTDVTTDEEWEKILKRNGLVLADVYSEWSGPCAGMVSILKKIKMELGGDNLSYATARCDMISSLNRFQGKSEPTWMFLQSGKMVNLLFGANCPELLEMLIGELKRIENNEPPIFSIETSEISPQEADRLQSIEEANLLKEAERIAQREAEALAKYEAELSHLTNSLSHETFLILFPWIFRDEEGNRRDKKSSPPYLELLEQLLPDHFSIEQESRRQLTLEMLQHLQKETEYVLTDDTKRLMLNGKCLCIRLKVADEKPELDIDRCLINLIFGEAVFPESNDNLIEGSFAQRNMPPLRELISDGPGGPIHTDPEEFEGKAHLHLTVSWVPHNLKNRVLAFHGFFTQYVETNYPYKDVDSDDPVTLFKYDSTRKKELTVALEIFSTEVVNFGVFERDKLPDPKLIAHTIKEFETEVKDKSSYEVLICVVKKVSPEAFLSFAGIGPYHVSENPEKGLEEARQYFPTATSNVQEEAQSDEEDKVGEEEGVPQE